MAKILKEGCIATCGHCRTEFSFTPSEVGHSTKQVPAGYEPQDEAYDKSAFTVGCPSCHRGVDVEKHLGPDAKRELRQHRDHSDYDL